MIDEKYRLLPGNLDTTEIMSEVTGEVAFVGKGKPGRRITQVNHFGDVASFSAIERRGFVRAVFACIEAVVFLMKDFAMRVEKRVKGGGPLSPAELSFILEQDHELDDAGEIKLKRAKVPFKANLRFAFKVMSKATATKFDLPVSGGGWQSITKAVSVRDRLMHPKKLSDLKVTDDEMRDVMEAYVWFFEQLKALCVEFHPSRPVAGSWLLDDQRDLGWTRQ